MRRRRSHCVHLERGFCDPCRLASRRAAGRRCQQRKRDAELARRNVSATTCQFRLSAYTRCAAKLIADTDQLGRTILRCELCERRRRGICRDCPARVAGWVGKSLRCARCTKRAHGEAIRRSHVKHHEERRVRARERYHANQDRRAEKLAYKRAYRLAHPEKVRAWRRREALAQGKHRLNWHRRYNRRKRRRDAKRQWARARYYELHPDRPVPRCAICRLFIDWTPGPGKGRPPARCDACARPEEKKRRAALGVSYQAVVEQPVGEWVPVIPKRKPRNCLTAGCTTVVSGRAKKCEHCKTIEAELARQLLAAHQGKGRRTDLERVA